MMDRTQKKLHQKKGGSFRKYEILKKEISVEVKDQGEYRKMRVDLEELDFDELVIRRHPSVTQVVLFASVILNVLLAAALLVNWLTWDGINTILLFGVSAALVTGFVFWAVNLFRLRKDKLIRGDTTLAFFYDEEEVPEVDSFIETLKEAQKKHLRKEYMKFDELRSLDSHEDIFQWLVKNEHITRSEYLVLMDELAHLRIMGRE